MGLHPSLVASVLGGVNRGHQRAAKAVGQVVAGDRHQPVVAVDHIEGEAIAELDAGGEHVGVHVLDPGDELAQVPWAARLADTVHDHSLALLLGRHALVAPGEHVDVDVLEHQTLRELAHVA